jgi:hypothetical protein
MATEKAVARGAPQTLRLTALIALVAAVTLGAGVTSAFASAKTKGVARRSWSPRDGRLTY